MPEYAARLVGNVTDRWTKKGKEREMEALSSSITQYAQEGWRLHSIQPVPIFFMGRTQQTALLAVYEHD
jgi:Domain of unknown function (DUF4177)